MRTRIRGVRVFDGASTTARTDVLVDGPVIAADDGGPVDAEVDGTGRTLLPGLIDAHTHVFDGGLELALRSGVTTELDMFCLPPNLARQRRLAAERDDVADLRSAGVLATAPGGHPSQLMDAFGAEEAAALGDGAGAFDTVAGAGQARAFVAARVAEGADYLKVVVDDGALSGARRPTLDAATLAALVEAAHDAGLAVVAHALSAAEVGAALDAGVDGLAHVFCDAAPGDPAAEELAARAADHGVFAVTTLAYFEAIGGSDPDHAHGDAAGPGDALSNAAHAVRVLHRAGVPLLAGTDANPFAPAHGAGMLRELVLLGAAGLAPEEVLAAATAEPARRFGLTDRGRIAPGLRADLLLVDGDPTRDLAAVGRATDVWRRGVRLPLGPSGR
ncbi:amidohydrolase family protein [Nocardiopsis trehalosi]|jgi:imidazolonepropionase-like amidohydrolase|uniref:amidohydrolase family protein n=1 Tax=Nocardiopsis trehalosi TaxID=109329 RepID=UPI00082E0AEB|nr:amidohydrolase family protein [Nocardiopsis trehalosi]